IRFVRPDVADRSTTFATTTTTTTLKPILYNLTGSAEEEDDEFFQYIQEGVLKFEKHGNLTSKQIITKAVEKSVKDILDIVDKNLNVTIVNETSLHYHQRIVHYMYLFEAKKKKLMKLLNKFGNDSFENDLNILLREMDLRFNLYLEEDVSVIYSSLTKQQFFFIPNPPDSYFTKWHIMLILATVVLFILGLILFFLRHSNDKTEFAEIYEETPSQSLPKYETTFLDKRSKNRKKILDGQSKYGPNFLDIQSKKEDTYLDNQSINKTAFLDSQKINQTKFRDKSPKNDAKFLNKTT
ncbi:hypothetical protein SNEBB_007384, partial [Seison nebaliae]